MPSALRPALPRASTPLPGSFTLTEDASTQEFDGGTVLLGGSPLPLFRISEGGGRLGGAATGAAIGVGGRVRPTDGGRRPQGRGRDGRSTGARPAGTTRPGAQ